ncbi:DNA polymerase III subunit gamma and tau [Leucobacter sp. GX24907]
MIGQSQVTEPLMTALRTERIGHAYLFSGPRGCGKTTSARILARCLNCVEGPTDAPCGQCPSCIELSRNGGGSLDVVEIDAASHGGVDDARDLRERAVFAPARDRYKIFIIDEAHMVTAGGFNALLKIVEEPPPHVKFIFATTEPDKVIGTIRSRTHHYPFRLVAPGPLIDYVQSLCDSEGVEVEAGVLPLVVRAGGGSVRDTLSILDQLIAGSEAGRVALDRASGLLGFTHTELLDDVVAAMGVRDSAAAFVATDRVVQTGQDPRRFVEDLLQRLRDLIVVAATTVQGAAAVFRGVPEDQLQRMFEQAQAFGPGELSRLADTVSAALDRMTGATAPKLQLELMIARSLVTLERNASASAVPNPGARASSASAPVTQTSSAPTSTPPASSPAATSQAARPGGAAPAPQNQAPSTGSPAPTAPAQSGGAQDSQPGAAQEPAPAMNAAEAARAAREFLRTDTAGAASFGRPVTDVLGMMGDAESGNGANDKSQGQAAPQQASSVTQTPPASVSGERTRQEPSAPGEAAASVVEPASSTPASSAPASSAPQADSPGATSASSSAVPASEGADLTELEQLWPDLLEELLESDRDAWNAVRVVTPLALEGDLLTVGIASRSDLEAFKTRGAGPLRETILAALGVRVRYAPKQVSSPAQTGPAPTGTEALSGTAQAPGAAPRDRHTPPATPSETGDADGDPDPAGDPDQDGRGAQAAGDPASAMRTETAPAAASEPEHDPIMERAAKLAALAQRPQTPAQPQTQPRPQADDAAPQPSPQPSVPAATSVTGAATGAADATAGRAARAAALGPVGAGQAWADYEPPESTDPDEDPYAEAGEDPYLTDDASQEDRVADARRDNSVDPGNAAELGTAAASGNTADPKSTARSAKPAEPGRSAEAATVAESNGASQQQEAENPAPRPSPTFTRYGEAVVREVLGAKFIEERPLTAGGEG